MFTLKYCKTYLSNYSDWIVLSKYLIFSLKFKLNFLMNVLCSYSLEQIKYVNYDNYHQAKLIAK